MLPSVRENESEYKQLKLDKAGDTKHNVFDKTAGGETGRRSSRNPHRPGPEGSFGCKLLNAKENNITIFRERRAPLLMGQTNGIAAACSQRGTSVVFILGADTYFFSGCFKRSTVCGGGQRPFLAASSCATAKDNLNLEQVVGSATNSLSPVASSIFVQVGHPYAVVERHTSANRSNWGRVGVRAEFCGDVPH